MRLLLLAACLMTCAFPIHAETPGTIKVVTYNVQFLPGFAAMKNKRGHNPYRLERIAEEVSKFDIIALQEIFEEGPRNAIFDGVKKVWGGTLYTMHSPKPADRYTGGCAILSRFPILETNSIIYENFSDPKEFGLKADGFAAKGCIHARIAPDAEKSDEFIDVFVTHLEARQDSMRPLQYQEMAAFIKEKSDPNHPVLVMGDFNTRGMAEYRDDPGSQYNALMKALQEARPDGGIRDIWLDLNGDKLGGTSEQESSDIGKRIDYIFLGNPVKGKVNLAPLGLEVNGYLDDVCVALSDHSAIIGTFELE